MKQTVPWLVAAATLAIVIACMIPASGQGNMTMTPGPGQATKTPANAVYVSQIPSGYRDWRLVSMTHEAGNLNSIGALLGNDIAIKAYRDKTLPFPDGTMLAAMHYTHSPSAENNKIFGQVQSYVPGTPTNLQFMIKDSKKYAATGGWGFGHFTPDGKPGSPTLLASCFPCHAKASRDFVFTRYAPPPVP